MIFVFGSNEAGIHGAGAARTALNRFGATWGKGWGVQGESFAIPTKDHKLRVLPLPKIRRYVSAFLIYASSFPDFKFYVTRIGTGLAGYKDSDIAPMFSDAPNNCYFDIEWKTILGENYNYFEGEL